MDCTRTRFYCLIMEFLLYLNLQGKQIIHDLISAKFHIHENVNECKNPDILSYVASPKKFVICTENIKRSNLSLNKHIPESVYHEAIHAAQICNNHEPLGVPSKAMNLSQSKYEDVKQSVKIFPNSYKVGQKEHEAYFFEDKPEKVRFYVRKFCF